MKLTIIVSYYKALRNLQVILAALNRQSAMNFEVVVSEDDNNLETREYIQKSKDCFNFPITHIFQQEDLGFRKNMMLNRAINISKYEHLVFIDGDCVPHKHFVKMYTKHFSNDSIIWGRRVLLGAKKTNAFLQNLDFKQLNFLSILTEGSSTKIKDGIYSPLIPLSFGFKNVKGCNWGVCKKWLLEVNGYDEDYVRAGVGEDDDISWRLLQLGLKTKSVKNRAIVYHLFHPRGYSSEGVKANGEILKERIKANQIVCLNGLKKIKK